ncbi:DUF3016 domain-containing protein [Neptunicella sp. SCSIO 80796]|uniref:DUF3016 domain-containing protein n=1 Tax=Neptunicella plasticusilytica TaxID=3117012 RepID=UPI003A4D8D65
MKKLTIALSAAVLLLNALPGYAQGELEVNWENPDKYRDVKPTSQTRSSFRRQTFEDIEKFLTKQLKDVPDGYKLTMNVTNLDLAGEVWPGMMVGLNSSSDVRLVKNLDIPRMDFSYKLTDSAGVVVKEGTEELKDMAFMDRGGRIHDSERLHYEKDMLDRWFEDTFEAYIQKNK